MLPITSVYLCQFYEIRARTEPVHQLFKEIKGNIPTRTRQIQGWQDSVKDGIYFTDFESYGLDINPAKNYNDTQVFMSKKLVTHTVSKIPKSKNRMDLARSKTNATLLTLFTTWQTSHEKYNLHNNTVRNWNLLKPFIQPVLFTNENDLSVQVAAMGWNVLPVSKTGTLVPVLKNMYLDAIKVFNSTFYAYANSDILFTDTLVITCLSVLTSNLNKSHPVMLIGQRTNVDNVTSIEALDQLTISKAAEVRGTLFNSWGEDYFIIMKNFPWKDIPDVVIGRRAYDNWLVLDARKRGYLIDATETILAVHQTTFRGNKEHLSHLNKDYNYDLLRRTFGKLNYAAGSTLCAELFTRYNSTYAPQIQQRKPGKKCFPF